MVTLTNVPPASTPIKVLRGQPFSLGIKFLLANDEPADLTDHSLTFNVKSLPHQGGTVVASRAGELLAPTEGWARINMTGDDTDLTPGDYRYALQIITDESYGAVLVKGTFTVEDTAADASPSAYTGEGAISTVELTLQSNNRLTVKVDWLPMPELIMGAVTLLPYYAAPKAEIIGQYPKQVLNLWLPGPGNPDHGVAPSYENVPPGAAFAAHWDGANWKIGSITVTVRPTARTDVYFILLGGTSNPAWMLSTDKRIP